MNRILCRAVCITWLAITLAACAPRNKGVPGAQAINTSSGFPTLAMPASEVPATLTPKAAHTAAAPGTALPTVNVNPQAYSIPVIGSGEADVAVQKWDGPALLHAKYTGGDSFGVQTARMSGGELATLKTLINTYGPYEGTVPLDLEPGQPTDRLQVVAHGPWVLEIRPLASAKVYQIPTTINGKGDDVVLVAGGSIGSMMAIVAGSDSFNVVGYTRAGERVVLFDGIAPFTGAAAVDGELSTLAVHATGPWSLQISAK